MGKRWRMFRENKYCLWFKLLLAFPPRLYRKLMSFIGWEGHLCPYWPLQPTFPGAGSPTALPAGVLARTSYGIWTLTERGKFQHILFIKEGS